MWFILLLWTRVVNKIHFSLVSNSVSQKGHWKCDIFVFVCLFCFALQWDYNPILASHGGYSLEKLWGKLIFHIKHKWSLPPLWFESKCSPQAHVSGLCCSRWVFGNWLDPEGSDSINGVIIIWHYYEMVKNRK
jgi:hypothetical protein